MDRHLDWEGCLNARDLGGVPVAAGGTTRWGQVVRADNPAFLTPDGWAAAVAYGIRTAVLLRTEGTTDDEPEIAVVPDEVALVRVVVEDATDAAWVERCILSGHCWSPLHLADMLDGWPERCAAGVAAVADAGPGGVIVSCGRGCDRTGVVAALLLALAGAPVEAIAEDWAASVERLAPRDPSFADSLDVLLAREATTVEGAFRRALDRWDVAERLREGGLTEAQLAAARARLAPEGP